MALSSTFRSRNSVSMAEFSSLVWLHFGRTGSLVYALTCVCVCVRVSAKRRIPGRSARLRCSRIRSSARLRSGKSRPPPPPPGCSVAGLPRLYCDVGLSGIESLSRLCFGWLWSCHFLELFPVRLNIGFTLLGHISFRFMQTGWLFAHL